MKSEEGEELPVVASEPTNNNNKKIVMCMRSCWLPLPLGFRGSHVT